MKGIREGNLAATKASKWGKNIVGSTNARIRDSVLGLYFFSGRIKSSGRINPMACMMFRVRNWYVRVGENLLITFFRSVWTGEGVRKRNSKFTDPNYPISEYDDVV